MDAENLPAADLAAPYLAAPYLAGPHAATPSGRPRARSLGIPFGGTPGPWNAITDVPGVQVGYTTIIRGDSVRTGVTAILPRGPAGAADPVAAGCFSQNGNGEMTGVSWIEESGTFSLPIAITNTHAVVATDAPLLPGQCQALGRRVTLGLARTGTTGSHFSGDLFLAFSTANPGAFSPYNPGISGGGGARPGC